MPRQPRSKGKTTPEFDPGELADLIHTPAVGTGVSSHLLDRRPLPPPIEATSLPQPPPLTIVDKLTTVDRTGGGAAAAAAPAVELTTVGNLDVTIVDSVDMTTVGSSDLTTVVSSDMATVHSADVTTVVNKHASTVDGSDVATVDKSSLTIVKLETEASLNLTDTNVSTVDQTNMATVFNSTTVDTSVGSLWVSEEGAYILPQKVRRVRFAQDALSAAEQSVYELLWSQPAGAGRNESASSRLVQAGYDFIVKRTGVSRKTVQRLVAKLIDKEFIAIEVPADIYSRTSTTYRVYSQRAALDRMTVRNRLFVAKVGPGVVHVHPMREITT